MARPVGIKGAEDPPLGDAILKELHALAGVFLLDQGHFVDSVGGIVKKGEEVVEDSRLSGEPFMGAAVQVKHHADERLPGTAKTVFIPLTSLLHLPGCLKQRFDEGIAALDRVVLF